MGDGEKQTDARWVLPSIGLVVALAGLVVPMTCNASLGDTRYASSHGGTVVGGGVAVAFAAFALLRGRTGSFGRPGAFALVVAAIGAALLGVGVLTMKRLPSAADAIDLDGPVRRVFEAMRDDHLEQMPGGDHATPDELAVMRALAHGFARGLGRWQDISGLAQAPGDGGTVVATGIARYERGTPRFEIKFGIVDGAPVIAHFDLTIPADQRPPVADAEKAARQITADLAAGAVDRVHDGIDPRLRSMDSIDAAIPKIRAVVAPSPPIDVVSHAHCDDSECYELRFPITGGAQRVRVTESSTFGIWLATSLTLGDG